MAKASSVPKRLQNTMLSKISETLDVIDNFKGKNLICAGGMFAECTPVPNIGIFRTTEIANADPFQYSSPTDNVKT